MAAPGCRKDEDNARSGRRWEEFSDKALGFAAEFPGVPERKTQLGERPGTPDTTVVVVGELAAAFMVSVTRIPEASENPKAAVEAAATGLASSNPMTVTERNEMQMGSHPAIELRAEGKDEETDRPMRIWAKFVVTDQALIQVLALWDSRGDRSEHAKRFVGSFRLDE